MAGAVAVSDSDWQVGVRDCEVHRHRSAVGQPVVGPVLEAVGAGVTGSRRVRERTIRIQRQCAVAGAAAGYQARRQRVAVVISRLTAQ